MDNKLLLVTAGTVAAGVGQNFIRQIKARSSNARRLHAIVRSIDTTNLPTTYSSLLSGEWFPMSIDPQYIDAIQDTMSARFPELEQLLYPVLPETTMAGGGGIRYNGAGAVLVNRDSLSAWLRQAFNDLASLGDRQRNISVAIVISAVGATGSGSLEHLIDIVVRAAQEAGIATPLQCDVFILQPGTIKVTDLGEANAVALYAEMAASQQKQDAISRRRYQGRTIMIGWGDGYSLPSLEQLEEATATMIRVINDPISNIASEYVQRLVDNHVLRDYEPATGLPTHLSTCTAVTVSLGNLEEQFLQRDVDRLVETMLLGEGSNDEEGRPNIFQDIITQNMLGNTIVERYEHLSERIAQITDLSCYAATPIQIQRGGGSAQARSARLRGMWQSDLERLNQAQAHMTQQAHTLADTIIQDIKRIRLQVVGNGLPLTLVKRDYERLQSVIVGIQREVPRYSAGELASTSAVESALQNLARAHLLNASTLLDNALTTVRNHLRSVSFRTASGAATNMLRLLARHCAAELGNLNALLSEAQRSIRVTKANQTSFEAEDDRVLHLAALADKKQVEDYYSKVSIFARPKVTDEDMFLMEEEPGSDSLAILRRKLKKDSQLDIFFEGDFEALLHILKNYCGQIVQERMKDYSVLDVLLEQNTLQERMAEAAAKAGSLLTLNRGLAPHCREMRHVIVFYRDNQRKILQTVIDKTFIQGQCTLIKSDDPAEIAVFYYADGLPMSAVNDLTGRCLEAFLARRQQWHLTNRNGHGFARGANRPISVPVYSGKNVEERVYQTRIIHNLYKVRNKAVVRDYSVKDVPDLDTPDRIQDDITNGGRI